MQLITILRLSIPDVGDDAAGVLPIEGVGRSLLVDVRKYWFEGNYMKMLKRLMSYRILFGHPVKRFIRLFNGAAGRLYQLHHRLGVLLDVMELGESGAAVNREYMLQHLNQSMAAADREWEPESALPSADAIEDCRDSVFRRIAELLRGHSLLRRRSIS